MNNPTIYIIMTGSITLFLPLHFCYWEGRQEQTPKSRDIQCDFLTGRHPKLCTPPSDTLVLYYDFGG